MKRFLLFLLLLVAFLIAGLPAVLADRALAAATQGELRLADPRGSLWHGHASLASPDRDEILRASMALDWDFEASALLRGRIAWVFREAGHPVLRLALGAHGAELSQLRLDLPLRLLTNAIPEAAARVGWRGDLRVESDALACGLNGRCDGRARVLWTDAGVDILPEQRFGSYAANLELRHGDLAFTVSTLAGEIAIQGKGSLPFGGTPHVDALVRGDPKIVDALPNVLGDLARRGKKSGEARILID